VQLSFERGDPKRPRGHAVVFFRAASDPSTVLASYVVVPPISMDFSKFIPPMFAAQLPGILPSGPQVFPLPPIPEKVESLDWLRSIAESRDDDLIDAGSVDPMDFQRLLSVMTEVANDYGGMYENRPPVETGPSSETPSSEDGPGVDVEELFLTLMSDTEKVGRLAKMAGTVRYAVEGDDQDLLEETVKEMGRVGTHLPEGYRIVELIAATRDPKPQSGRLAELLLQRCYKLAAGEYDALKSLDTAIDKLKKE
jgi:hypothetical protein